MKPPLPDFDRIARPYRWLEYLALGPLLQHTRTRYLPLLKDRRRALILGDGDGRFTAALLAANPSVRVHAVDTSAAMLHLLRRNAVRAILSAASRLRTTHAAACEIIPARDTDLVVTHFLLDCLTQSQVDALVQQLTPRLAPGALWLVSEFRIPAGVLQWPARLYIRLLYLTFRILTGLRTTRLPDHASPLTRAGLRPVATHTTLFGLLTSELWQRSSGTAEPGSPPHLRVLPVGRTSK